MVKPPSISVAIACYNAQAFIGAALRGLINQIHSPLEIIVVDDGSIDRSKAVVEAIGGVRVIRHEHNLGIAAARNTAWQKALGDIIVYLDADTVPHPRFILELGRCYGGYAVDGVGGRAVEMFSRCDADLLRSEILFQHWGPHMRPNVPFLFGLCASYRRSTLAAIGGFDPRFRFSGEDMDLGFRMRHAGRRLIYTPKAVVYHMRMDDSRSVQKMAYRHCYGGFMAQRKNHCFLNKLTLVQSLRLFFKQLINANQTKGHPSYTAMSIRLHWIMLSAWIDARRAFKDKSWSTKHGAHYFWEGHYRQPAQRLLHSTVSLSQRRSS